MILHSYAGHKFVPTATAARSSRCWAVRGPGRSRQARSRMTACDASAFCARSQRAILKARPGPGSFWSVRKDWVKPIAATSRLTFPLTAPTQRTHRCWQRSWLNCGPDVIPAAGVPAAASLQTQSSQSDFQHGYANFGFAVTETNSVVARS